LHPAALGAHPTQKIVERLVALGFAVARSCDGVDPIKGRKTRVAVVGR
jgi:hypothetical protein